MSGRDYYAMVVARDPNRADAINKGAAIISGRNMHILADRSGGDPSNLNHTIDAAVDEVIAAFNGDAHLALFTALGAYGVAMYDLHGPPGPHLPGGMAS